MIICATEVLQYYQPKSLTYYFVSTHIIVQLVTFILCKYRNINLLSIDFPLRVRLRSRLTPG